VVSHEHGSHIHCDSCLLLVAAADLSSGYVCAAAWKNNSAALLGVHWLPWGCIAVTTCSKPFQTLTLLGRHQFSCRDPATQGAQECAWLLQGT